MLYSFDSFSARKFSPTQWGGENLVLREEQTKNEPVNAAQTDSLRLLSDESAQLKSKLDQEDRKKQIEQVWKRKKYWKFGFSNSNIERTDGTAMNWETQFAFSVQRGKTGYLHSKPIGGLFRFGIDYGFFELSYAKLKLKSIAGLEENLSTPGISSVPGSGGGFDDIVSDDPSASSGSLMGIDLGMHKIDYSLHVGPSISINPWKRLIIAAYFHARPTATTIIANDTFSYGFGCTFSAGVSISYKAISVGVEGVWSTIKYTQSSFEEEDDEEDYGYDYAEDSPNLFNTEKFKLKEKGPRFYVAIRF